MRKATNRRANVNRCCRASTAGQLAADGEGKTPSGCTRASELATSGFAPGLHNSGQSAEMFVSSFKLIDGVIAVVVAVHARHGDDFWVPLSSSLNMTRTSDGVGLASVFPRANCAQVVLKREQRSARLVPRAPSD